MKMKRRLLEYGKRIGRLLKAKDDSRKGREKYHGRTAEKRITKGV